VGWDHHGADCRRNHCRGDRSSDDRRRIALDHRNLHLLYGLGSGALAVARATIPLVFYDNVEFAKATSRIAMPLNLISAASPRFWSACWRISAAARCLASPRYVRPQRC